MLVTVQLGHGPPAVFVHGDVFDAEATWSAQYPLAEHHRLVLVNRRGFGASPDVAGEDFDVDADDVVEVLDGLGAGSHLVGHSYGGVVALLVAARRPELVHSLAVIEPPAFGLVPERNDVQEFIATVSRIEADQPTPEEFLPRFIAAVGGDASRLPTPIPPPLVRAAGVQLHGRWPWEAEIPVDDLARTSFPKLVISGGHSEMFDAVCDNLEHTLGAARAICPGAGHSVPTVGAPVNEALSSLWQ
jgi:pimeloyl-ACP methyl ester carboxylesterase